jgi:hypothetical protein
VALDDRFQTPERGRPPARVYRRLFDGRPVNRCTVLDYWPRRHQRQDACAGSGPAAAYGAPKIRQTPPKAEDRSSMTVPRLPADPSPSPRPARARAGPASKRSAAASPAPNPHQPLQMADSKPRHSWMTRHTVAGSPPTSSPMVQPLSAAFGAPGSEATGRRRRRRGLARSQGTPCVLVWRPLGLAFRGKRSRSAHAPAP